MVTHEFKTCMERKRNTIFSWCQYYQVNLHPCYYISVVFFHTVLIHPNYGSINIFAAKLVLKSFCLSDLKDPVGHCWVKTQRSCSSSLILAPEWWEHISLALAFPFLLSKCCWSQMGQIVIISNFLVIVALAQKCVCPPLCNCTDSKGAGSNEGNQHCRVSLVFLFLSLRIKGGCLLC